MLNVQPTSVPLLPKLTVNPWGNWGTSMVAPFPEEGGLLRTPLPISSDPASLTVAVAPEAVKSVGGGKLSDAPPLTVIFEPSMSDKAAKLAIPPLTLSVPLVKDVI